MTDTILVLNAGSSSIKFSLFPGHLQPTRQGLLCEGQCTGIGHLVHFTAKDGGGSPLLDEHLEEGTTHEDALAALLRWLTDQFPQDRLIAAGHRVVHGGALYTGPVCIDATVIDELRRLIPLAPLHQPHHLAAIAAVSKLHPTLPQIACFDTSFHHTQPEVAITFALPRHLTEEGVRRYGFHGLSYEYIAGVLPEIVGPAVADGRVVVAHLGSGASMCALKARRSLATTMGFTALDGLPMSRRCGNLDPGVVLYLMDEKNMTARAISDLLYNSSGLLGVSGVSDGMKTLLESNRPQAAEAVELFVYRICRELGSLAAALGGLDALVFTAGIGENAAEIRRRVCEQAAWFGFEIDDAANDTGGPRITKRGGEASAWVIPTDEDLMIARHVWRLVGKAGAPSIDGPSAARAGGQHMQEQATVAPKTPAITTDATGLTEDEATRRLAQFGENALVEHHVSALERLLRFFWGPIPWMIEVAAALSAALQHWDDLAIILLMLFINAGVGFWQEFKADNAIALLKQRLALKARVKRDGEWKDIEARLLVPGDVVHVKLGNVVPGDLRLIEGAYLSVDQSTLTGESLPVDKKAGDDAYSGSIAKQGEMDGVVTATGMNTYFGHTARLVQQAGAVSHFQRAVLRIGNFLILTTAGLVVIIVVAGLFRRNPLLELIQFALILAVASIPVALPAVLSVTMAVGAERLARMRAIVSRLVSIEEMAGMNTLCSDKTGTLTKNELTLGDPQPVSGVARDDLLLAATLASRRDAPDAIDVAILASAPADSTLDTYTVKAFHPFDPVVKRAEAEVEHAGKNFKVAKGAPQVIVDLCEPPAEERAAIAKIVDQDAARGYRTLGVARIDDMGKWRFLGLLPLFDPPRDDCAETIKATRELGVDIKMVTGDHEAIAKEIAGQLDLGRNIVVADDVFGEAAVGDKLPRILSADGFARVFPEHKFAIVKALQEAGRIVGMTGDGVNDAPALKQADVGIAVSGATDAARAAAALVLTAPGLSIITTAIEEARRIFERMTAYAIYRIAETMRLLLFMAAAILFFDFYPVTAIMVVLLALLNDIPIMMIAYDNAPFALRPVRWDMTRVLTIASVLGFYGVVESFVLYWLAKDYFALPAAVLQATIFLKLLISGHMTIYLTRNKGWAWEQPWPSWKLVVPCEATQLFGTLIVVYGVAMAPTGWWLALLVWAYTLVSFFVANALKVATYRLLGLLLPWHARHLARIEGHVAGHDIASRLAGAKFPIVDAHRSGR